MHNLTCTPRPADISRGALFPEASGQLRRDPHPMAHPMTREGYDGGKTMGRGGFWRKVGCNGLDAQRGWRVDLGAEDWYHRAPLAVVPD